MLLTSVEVAQTLGYKLASFNSVRCSTPEKLPAPTHYIGRSPRWDSDELQKWINNHKVKPSTRASD